MDARTKELVSFPMPIDIEDALNMGFKRSDIVYRLIGNRRVSCVIVEGTQEQADDFLRAVRREQKSEDRENRCLIADGKGGYIVCPECNKCGQCKRAGSMDFDSFRPIHLDKPIGDDPEEDNTMEVPGDVDIESEVIAMMTLADLLVYLRTFNGKKYAEIFQGLFDLKSIAEIAEELNLSWSTCRDRVKKVRKLAQAFTGLTQEGQDDHYRYVGRATS